MQTFIRAAGAWALLVVVIIAAFIATGRGLFRSSVAMCVVLIIAAGMAAVRTMRAERSGLCLLVVAAAAAGLTVSVLVYLVDWAAGSGNKPLETASLLRYFGSPPAMRDFLLIALPASALVIATLVGHGFGRLARRFTHTTTKEA